MYLSDGTVFAKLITEAGLSQAKVLIIIFGERKTSWKTLCDESIYGSVLQQGRDLYMKGRNQASLLREQTRSGVSESVALVTVDNHASRYQLWFMKNFVESAFTDEE
ncbi:uncharacterized protein LOC106180050 [Lingula anatina]|uniref:Uncharacterized protein LOC106180050 n=1 Tax=Lingula anatina TaxID=7574 RepID=A0A1S3K9S4_LINAN|nr:uncharacterized protein LOC106180050 [Lingula anatina]|eukprot:XP_013419380.1 uncharacterized protein LOC106180050 [Lingula anatina]